MLNEKHPDTETATGYQARVDELYEYARNFDRRNPPSVESVRWDWTKNFDDGTEAIFIAGNLQTIRSAMYEIKYPELKGQRLCPVDTNVNPGLEREVVRTIDVAGDPAVSRDQPDDVPTVELNTGEGDVKFFSLVLSYAYSDQEARKAMLEGMPLPFLKAKATRDVMARKLDTMIFIGETKYGSKGLLNSSNTLTYATPASGAGGSKKWSDKSADQVLLDLNAPADQIISTTKEIEEPDTWLLPLDAHTHINTRRVGDGTSQTILKFFLENRDGMVKVERTTKSNVPANGGIIPSVSVSRMVVYRNDPSKLQMKVPLPFEQKQPQVMGFKVYTYCHMRAGELALWAPKSMIYADDVI